MEVGEYEFYKETNGYKYYVEVSDGKLIING